MKQILLIVLFVATVSSLITIPFTLNQIQQEEKRQINDLQYRSSLIAYGVNETIETDLFNNSNSSLQNLIQNYARRQKVVDLAVVDATGRINASTSTLPHDLSQIQKLATNVIYSDKADGDLADVDDKKMYIFATPLHSNKTVIGALLIAQNASYINDRLTEIWTNNILRLLLQTALVSIALIFLMKAVFYKTIEKLTKSLQTSRLKSAKSDIDQDSFENPLFAPLVKEVSHMQKSLLQAKLVANEEAKASLEKLDFPWTAERLKEFTKDVLKNRRIIMVSNREPYIHTKVGDEIKYYFPASGVVTAIEPIMQACGGLWIAYGSGDADKLVVDKSDKIAVPPDDPKYTLKRVWLSEEEIEGYYCGFSNEALYALSLMAHTRPTFRKEHWDQYKKVNEKFAQSVLQEIKNEQDPIIFIQDLHFSILPRMIKNSRPDATIGIFWHEPWVSPESFSICPWKKEILDGMLGADLIGFHTQLHCNNFIETVRRELESLIDYEHFTITRDGHLSSIKPFPISIAFSNGYVEEPENAHETQRKAKLLKDLKVHAKYIGLGVDRLDYTKGILERFKGVEIFLKTHPEYIGQFTLIQISPTSRTSIKKYQEFADDVHAELERINDLYKTKNWKPIVLIEKLHTHEELDQYYRLANLCLVTSLHDGMNLVAKEFIASRNDGQGVLILSQFTGASKELKDAIIINPYSGEQTSEAIFKALNMTPGEQNKRMKKLRNSVRNNNIYRWSAEFLKTIVGLE